MAISEYKHLTAEQRAHFLEHGWVKIRKAVKEEYLKQFTENVWVRLGYDPDDKSTWAKEKVRSEAQREGLICLDCSCRYTCRGTGRYRRGSSCQRLGARCVGTIVFEVLGILVC